MKYRLFFEVSGELEVDAPSEISARDLFFDDIVICEEVEKILRNNEITLTEVRLIGE